MSCIGAFGLPRPAAEFEKLLQNREQIVAEFKKYGFTYVTMDLQGYRMGSMNETLNLKG